jgi:hypothetical protein
LRRFDTESPTVVKLNLGVVRKYQMGVFPNRGRGELLVFY